MKSIMQDDMDQCYLCGRNGAADPLEAHHVFGGPIRRLSDRDGKQAVHRCKETADRLKAEGQRAWMENTGGSVEAFRVRYGKNYLED